MSDNIKFTDNTLDFAKKVIEGYNPQSLFEAEQKKNFDFVIKRLGEVYKKSLEHGGIDYLIKFHKENNIDSIFNTQQKLGL
jgi:hypothetical protein